MAERVVTSIEVLTDKRCSKCVFGHQIVSYAMGGSVSDDGTKTGWVLNRTIPVGQTRNCFNWFQRTFEHPPKFIYPNIDDTCINPRKFKQKVGASTDSI